MAQKVDGSSGSRKINGYLNAYRRHVKLLQRLQAREERLNPLREKTKRAHDVMLAKWTWLNGGQQAAARQIVEKGC